MITQKAVEQVRMTKAYTRSHTYSSSFQGSGRMAIPAEVEHDKSNREPQQAVCPRPTPFGAT